ncbi:MAG: thiosulfate oxidation carrier protein SoxY [Campylobacterales bacterium]|nr:thiosulfate oxidation carrier protein SoxY [Campylobacterales bacterium]
MQRREFLKNMSIMASLAIVAVSPLKVLAAELSAEEQISKIVGSKGAKTGVATLVAPAIAENGQVVPLKVEVNHPMEEGNYVKAIHLYAAGNPTPRIVTVNLTPANGKAYFSTRTKLAKSQDVFVVAELSNGTFLKDTKNVKVTIGGCG